MWRLVLRLLVAGSTLSLGNACRSSGAFVCESDSQCVADGVAGICAPPGFCAFPSENCPSGHRFGAHAGSLAHACVQEPDASSSATSTETGGQEHASSEGSEGSQGSTTGDVDDTGTSSVTGDVDDTGTSSVTGDTESSTGGPSCTPLWEDDLTAGTNWIASPGPQVELSFGLGGLLITPDASTAGYGQVRWMNTIPVDVQITVHLAQVLEAVDVAETMVLIEDPEATNRLVFFVSGIHLNMHARVAGEGILEPGPVYDPEAHRFLRIRNVAGAAWFGASADGVRYTELWSTEGLSAGVEPLHVSLAAGIWDVSDDPIGQARFAAASACIPDGSDG
jgi:hypothetical protein